MAKRSSPAWVRGKSETSIKGGGEGDSFVNAENWPNDIGIDDVC